MDSSKQKYDPFALSESDDEDDSKYSSNGSQEEMQNIDNEDEFHNTLPSHLNNEEHEPGNLDLDDDVDDDEEDGRDQQESDDQLMPDKDFLAHIPVPDDISPPPFVDFIPPPPTAPYPHVSGATRSFKFSDDRVACLIARATAKLHQVDGQNGTTEDDIRTNHGIGGQINTPTLVGGTSNTRLPLFGKRGKFFIPTQLRGGPRGGAKATGVPDTALQHPTAPIKNPSSSSLVDMFSEGDPSAVTGDKDLSSDGTEGGPDIKVKRPKASTQPKRANIYLPEPMEKRIPSLMEDIPIPLIPIDTVPNLAPPTSLLPSLLSLDVGAMLEQSIAQSGTFSKVEMAPEPNDATAVISEPVRKKKKFYASYEEWAANSGIEINTTIASKNTSESDAPALIQELLPVLQEDPRGCDKILEGSTEAADQTAVERPKTGRKRSADSVVEDRKHRNGRSHGRRKKRSSDDHQIRVVEAGHKSSRNSSGQRRSQGAIHRRRSISSSPVLPAEGSATFSVNRFLVPTEGVAPDSESPHTLYYYHPSCGSDLQGSRTESVKDPAPVVVLPWPVDILRYTRAAPCLTYGCHPRHFNLNKLSARKADHVVDVLMTWPRRPCWEPAPSRQRPPSPHRLSDCHVTTIIEEKSGDSATRNDDVVPDEGIDGEATPRGPSSLPQLDPDLSPANHSTPTPIRPDSPQLQSTTQLPDRELLSGDDGKDYTGAELHNIATHDSGTTLPCPTPTPADDVSPTLLPGESNQPGSLINSTDFDVPKPEEDFPKDSPIDPANVESDLSGNKRTEPADLPLDLVGLQRLVDSTATGAGIPTDILSALSSLTNLSPLLSVINNLVTLSLTNSPLLKTLNALLESPTNLLKLAPDPPSSTTTPAPPALTTPAATPSLTSTPQAAADDSSSPASLLQDITSLLMAHITPPNEPSPARSSPPPSQLVGSGILKNSKGGPITSTQLPIDGVRERIVAFDVPPGVPDSPPSPKRTNALGRKKTGRAKKKRADRGLSPSPPPPPPPAHHATVPGKGKTKGKRTKKSRGREASSGSESPPPPPPPVPLGTAPFLSQHPVQDFAQHYYYATLPPNQLAPPLYYENGVSSVSPYHQPHSNALMFSSGGIPTNPAPNYPPYYNVTNHVTNHQTQGMIAYLGDVSAAQTQAPALTNKGITGSGPSPNLIRIMTTQSI